VRVGQGAEGEQRVRKTRSCASLSTHNIVGRVRVRLYFQVMKGLRYVYWQDGDFWLGYLEEYPDYMTQGESLQDLQEHLRDLYTDLSGGHIPAVRKVTDLEVA
jgi:hypothetical protein